VAAGIALLVLLLVFAVVPNPSAAGWVGVAVVGICLAGLYRATTGSAFSPIAVTFWAFALVWVGFAPLLQIRDGRLPWPDELLSRLFLPAQLILLATLVAFWAGYTGLAGRRTAAPPATSGPVEAAARFPVTVGAAVGVTAATVCLALVAIPLTGGIGVRFSTRDAVVAALAEAGLSGGSDQAMAGLLNMLPSAASLAALVLCLYCLRHRLAAVGRSRTTLLAATAAAVLLNIVFNNPLSASRFISLSTMLAAVITIVRFDTLLRRTAFTLLTVGGLAFVYPLANVFRNSAQREHDLLRVGGDAYFSNDFDGFQQTVNTLFHVEQHGYTFGHHLLSAVLFWVPRSIWHGKALPAGFPVAADRGYEFQNLALPLWAEIFLEFSWVGVIVFFFLYGRLARRLDRSLTGGVHGMTAAAGLVFAACQIGLVRGPAGAQFPFVGTALGAVIVGTAGYAMLKRFRRRPQPDRV
jgi:oligosaccharide repeat unit polymerase